MNTVFAKIEGFDWDEGNARKNWERHGVVWSECEEVFLNVPILVYEDKKHSIQETRYRLLGRTNEERKLFLVFTMRKNKIRIISARPMNKKERKIYEALKKDSKI